MRVAEQLEREEALRCLRNGAILEHRKSGWWIFPTDRPSPMKVRPVTVRRMVKDRLIRPTTGGDYILQE